MSEHTSPEGFFSKFRAVVDSQKLFLADVWDAPLRTYTIFMRDSVLRQVAKSLGLEYYGRD